MFEKRVKFMGESKIIILGAVEAFEMGRRESYTASITVTTISEDGNSTGAILWHHSFSDIDKAMNKLEELAPTIKF
jgi:hypothetical protein